MKRSKKEGGTAVALLRLVFATAVLFVFFGSAQAQEELTISFDAALYSATMATLTDPGEDATLLVDLSAPSSQQIDIPLEETHEGLHLYDIVGTGETPNSRLFIGGDLPTPFLRFAPGDTRITLTVSVRTSHETVDDVLRLTLNPNDGSGVGLGTHPTATVCLWATPDSDGTRSCVQPPPPVRKPLQVSFDRESYRATEHGDPATVTVRLDSPSDRTFFVPLVTDPESGDFTFSDDVTTLFGRQGLRFSTGDTSQSFTVTATPDDDLEDETVQLRFGNLPARVSAGTPATAAVTLVDGDRTPLTVSFDRESYRATEHGEPATVTVRLDSPSDRAFVLPLVTDPESGDFTLSDDELVFDAGDTSQAFTVTAAPDGDIVDETVQLRFGNLPVDVSRGTPATATVTLGGRRPDAVDGLVRSGVLPRDRARRSRRP